VKLKNKLVKTQQIFRKPDALSTSRQILKLLGVIEVRKKSVVLIINLSSRNTKSSLATLLLAPGSRGLSFPLGAFSSTMESTKTERGF